MYNKQKYSNFKNMKVSQLRQLIREEIRGVLNENLSYDKLTASLMDSDVVLGEEKDMGELFLQLTSYAGTDKNAKAVLDKINDYLIKNKKIVIDGVDCTKDYWDIIHDNIEVNSSTREARSAIKLLKTLIMFPENANKMLKGYTQSDILEILDIADLTKKLDKYIMSLNAVQALERGHNVGGLREYLRK